ncbi:hypothetical protein BTM25_06230 [Actinomadura rubteroloni]|uniref:V8-like Glu-specific endopeptidase n=1 Tax=Actinomadura rubteroloni TaxID=1926885 RepID=A0A2P4UMJ9_9ACTN|nr:hypothetical protein [Actinomadura rubteroloni]POM26229.1 hypothetical protein BTM25_06230 [Actinomadura rubteroloni]
MTKINWLQRPLGMSAAAVVAGVLAVAVVPGAEAGTAPAGVAGTTASVARLSDGSPVSSAAAAKKVETYWTAARMKAARPAPVPKAAAGTRSATTARIGKPGFTPPAEAAREGDVRASLYESPVVGKVFFTNPAGGDFVCSASALNSPSRQLVITAGHCVHQGNGGTWMKNWIFVPQYNNGSRPHGTFAAKSFRTFSSWANSRDTQRDVGLVTTYPNNGTKLVDEVGGNGLIWNQPKSVATTVFAYPGNLSNGMIQHWFQGTTMDGGNYTIALDCGFEGGASGGPWMTNFDNGTGRGLVNGVTSTVDFFGITNRSSYFDDGVAAMVDAQGRAT